MMSSGDLIEVFLEDRWYTGTFNKMVGLRHHQYEVLVNGFYLVFGREVVRRPRTKSISEAINELICN